MVVSFKVSNQGNRFQPKPKPNHQSSDLEEINLNNLDDENVEVDAHSPTNGNGKRKIDATEDDGDVAETTDAEVSFILNIFPDGYSIEDSSKRNVRNQNTVQDQSKSFLRPYDRRSENLVNAIECGQIPVDFLGDISCKYINGSAVCEVWDYRKESSASGVRGSPTTAYPSVTRVSLKMSPVNMVKEISDDSWTYGNLLESESRILSTLYTKIDLDPTPNFDRLCQNPTVIKLNLDIPALRRKRLRQMSGAATAAETSELRLGESEPVTGDGKSRLVMGRSDLIDLTNKDVGQSDTLAMRLNTPSYSVPATPSISHQLRNQMQTGDGNMQDHGPQNASGHGKESPYTVGISSVIYGKRGNQDGQMSSIRSRSDSKSLDSNQLKMEGINAPETLRNNMLVHHQSTGMEKQMSTFTMGQQGKRSSIKQMSVETETTEKSEPNQMQPRLPVTGGTRSVSSTSSRLNSVSKLHVISGVGGMIGPFSPIQKEDEIIMCDRFSKIKTPNERFQLDCKNNKTDDYKINSTFRVEQLTDALFNDPRDETLRDETCKKPLSKSLVGGNVNVCKTRILEFVQDEHLEPGDECSVVPKFQTRLILSEKPSDGTVAMHYGELIDCDYDCLAEDELLCRLPNTHTADLLAAQFCSQMVHEGYRLEADHLKPKPIMVRSSVSQPKTSSGSFDIFDTDQISEGVSSQPTREDAKQSNGGTSQHNMLNERMHPHSGVLLPSSSMSHQSEPQTSLYQQQQQQQQNQNSLMQQKPQRSSENLMLMGHNSSMKKLSHNHSANDWVSELRHQLLQQQPQSPMESKMMMGPGNVSRNNSMLRVQGLGNAMQTGGTRAGTGIVSPIIGQSGRSINQGSTIKNSMSQQLRSGPIKSEPDDDIMIIEPRMAQSKPIGSRNVSLNNSRLRVQGLSNLMGIGGTPAGTGIVSRLNPRNINQGAAFNNSFSQLRHTWPVKSEPADAIMAAKPRMAQSQPIGPTERFSPIGKLQGTNREIHPGSSSGSSCASMLNYGINMTSDMNEMQRDVIAPPKSMGIGAARAGTGIVSPITGQSSMNINQGSTINKSTSQLLLSGPVKSEPADAIMATKPRMSRSEPNVPIGPVGQFGRLQGANSQIDRGSGSNGSSMLSYGMIRTGDMQRNVMAPPKPVSVLSQNQNCYMNQQQFYLQNQQPTSHLQAVISPYQQVGSASPWIGIQQQQQQQESQQPMRVNPLTGSTNEEGQMTLDTIDKYSTFWKWE